MATEVAIYNQWYDNLIEDLTEIVDGIVEDKFNLAWSMISRHHQMGTRILQENDNFERSKVYGKKIVQRIAESIGRSERTVYLSIKLSQLYPDIDLLPEGKDVTWGKVITKYLTTGEKKPTIKKGDLVKQIEAFKELLETELKKELQSVNNGEIAINKSNVEFIRYLQDQLNKITGGANER